MRNPANIQCPATTIKQINLVYGKAHRSEAAIRLMVDAVFLDVLTTIKRSSAESSLHMALETPHRLHLPTCSEGKFAEKLVQGRMDYTLWYGNPKEAETNLVVVEARHGYCLSAARYEAISYMGKQLTDGSLLVCYMLIIYFSSNPTRPQQGWPGQDPHIWGHN